MTRKKTLLDQFQKPKGWLGRFILWRMNRWHSNLTNWGLTHISINAHDTILDVGCGGGRTADKLAAMATQGKVYGIDYSEESVAASRRKNARAIAAGRVEIRQGSVSRLPFPDDMFNLVTAVETHFFWPDLPADIREVLRVLKPGGSFIVIAEVYNGSGGKVYSGNGGNKMAKKLAEKYPLTNMKILSVEEHRELFAKAGYSDIQVIEEPGNEWICCVGKKP